MKIQTLNFGELELLNYEGLSDGEMRYVLKMRNHPEIKKWMYNQQDITELQHCRFKETLKTDNTKSYLLVKQAGAIIGSFNFTKIDQSEKTADFGLYANPFESFPGAGQTLVDVAVIHAKNNLKLSVLNLTVFAENQRAINFYNKVGFVQTEIREENDQVILCMQKIINKSEKS